MNTRKQSLGERMVQYAYLVRLHKPIGIFLLLWPTLWALWIAGEGRPAPPVVLIFILGVILMRSAGCAINDYADRDFDPHVARTRDRPIASGKVAPAEALIVFAVLSLGAFGLVLLLNRLTLLLSLGGLVLAVTYPFTKRFIQLPQVYLGAAFGWAVPMAYAAVTGSVPASAWWLFGATLLWATAYDTMYAMADREDDIRIGVKSTAILFGRWDRLAIAVLQLLVFVCLVAAGIQAHLGSWYYGALVLAGLIAGYHQYLIRAREPQACFQAFLHNNWLGAVVFSGIFLQYFMA